MNNVKEIKIKKKLTKLFLILLVAPTVLWCVLCLIPGVSSAMDFDLGEKRDKAEFPSGLSSDFCAQLEDFYEDRAPFRSAIISLQESLTGALESPYETSWKGKLVALFHNNDSKQTDDIAAETTTAVDFNDLFGDDETENAEITTTEQNIIIDTGDTETQSAASETDTTAGAGETQTVETTEQETTVYYPPIIENVADVLGNIDTTSYYPAVIKNSLTLVGRGDWLFFAEESNLACYLGTNIPDEGELGVYLTAMLGVRTACGTQNKQLAYLIAPSKTQVYSEYMPTYEITDTYKREQRLVDYIQANTDINICYPIEALTAIKPYYLSYHKYDTHWNQVGAFIGYQSALKMLGMKTTNLLTLNVTPEVYATGDLMVLGGLSGGAPYNNDRNYSIDYKTDVQILSEEGTPDDDGPKIYHVTSTASNSAKVVVIGDSYRNYIRQFIYKDYADVTVMHHYALGTTTDADSYIKNADIILFVYTERDDPYLLADSQYVAALLAQ